MADQQLIGDILSARRKHLGLSIDRVVAGTKLQRRIIEAFERTDFEAMPAKGYAKATLASYARFLGLDPNEIIHIYEEQLYDYEHSMNANAYQREQTGIRRGYGQSDGRTHDYDRSDEEQGYSSGYGYDRRSGRASTSRGLYSDRSYASASSRSRANSPAAGADASRDYRDRDPRSRTGSSQRTYSSRSYEGGNQRPSYGSTSRSALARTTYSDRPSSRPNAAAGRASSSSRASGYGSRTSSQRYSTSSRPSNYDRNEHESRGRVSSVLPYDDGYLGGSGGNAGSYGYHPSIRSTERVEQAEQQSRTLGGLSGFLTGLNNFFRENRLASFITIAVIALLLIVVIVFGVSSCIRNSKSSQTSTIPVVTVGASSAPDSEATSEADQTAENAAAASGTGDANATSSATSDAAELDLLSLPINSTLTITVDSNTTLTPWIEVVVDGVAMYAAQAAAGETQTYTITQSASIRLSNPDLVSITVNGVAIEPVVDETGMASVTLAVSQEEIDAAAAQAAADQAAADQAAADQATTDQATTEVQTDQSIVAVDAAV